MPDYTPVNNVDSITLTASAAITGGQVLVSTGINTVAPSAGQTVKALGVALHDAPSGGRVTLAVLPGAVHEVPVQGVAVVASSTALVPDAAGTVSAGASLGAAAAAGTLLGIALNGATGPAKIRFIGA
jgi:Uncharacterized conserved protein (DUF2190)